MAEAMDVCHLKLKKLVEKAAEKKVTKIIKNTREVKHTLRLLNIENIDQIRLLDKLQSLTSDEPWCAASTIEILHQKLKQIPNIVLITEDKKIIFPGRTIGNVIINIEQDHAKLISEKGRFIISDTKTKELLQRKKTPLNVLIHGSLENNRRAQVPTYDKTKKFIAIRKQNNVWAPTNGPLKILRHGRKKK